MRWLLFGGITSAVGEALRRHGHAAMFAEELSLAPGTSHATVLDTAHKAQLDLMTADMKLATAPFEESLHFGRCIAVLNVGSGEVEQDDAVDRFFKRYPRPATGRLYTVTQSRVKIRQLPGPRH